MKPDETFVKQQANDWLVKLDTNSMTAGDEQRFVEWLEADERHGIALHQAEQTWALMHQVTSEPAQTPSNWVVQPWRKSWLSIAASLLVVATSLLWWQQAYFAIFADHYTNTGERLETALSDGSTLVLNTNTAVDIDFDETKRLVKVLSGEVYVKVAPAKPRPFVVQIGDTRVTALGTEFIVKQYPGTAASVIVTEHSVRVEASKQANTVLNQGYKLTIDEDNEQLSTPSKIDINRVQSWRTGRYIFDSKPLSEVVAELNRYYSGKIIVPDTQLQQIPVTGVLDLDNPKVSLNNLAISIGAKVTSLTDYLLVIENG